MIPDDGELRDNRRDRRDSGKAGEHENESFPRRLSVPAAGSIAETPGDLDSSGNEIEPGARAAIKSLVAGQTIG
jgi:hypothetical protein